MIHGPKETKSSMKSACDCPLSSIKPARETSASFEEPVSKTDVSTVLHFAVFVYVAVQ